MVMNMKRISAMLYTSQAHNLTKT